MIHFHELGGWSLPGGSLNRRFSNFHEVSDDRANHISFPFLAQILTLDWHFASTKFGYGLFQVYHIQLTGKPSLS